MKRSELKKQIEAAKAGYAASYWENNMIEIVLDCIMREYGFEPEPVDEVEAARRNAEPYLKKLEGDEFDAILGFVIAAEKRIKEQEETIENLHHQLNAGYQAYIEDTARRDAKIKEQAETIAALSNRNDELETCAQNLDDKIREIEARLNAPEPDELIIARRNAIRENEKGDIDTRCLAYWRVWQNLESYIELLKGRK